MSDDLTRELVELRRSQIGAHIHDDLIPLIFAASSGTAKVSRDLPDELSGQRDTLDQVSQWLNSAMIIGRQILADVYPPVLTGSLWARAAKESLQQLSYLGDTTIDWQIEEVTEDVSQTVAITFYQVVMEAIRNAVRHGKAEKITVSAMHRDQQTIVTVIDEGKGFDPSNIPSDRFGIRVMMTRAKLAHGSLSIESESGGPTMVKLVVADPENT